MADNKKKPINNKTNVTKKREYVKVSKEGYDRWDRGGSGVAAPTKPYKKGN